MLLYRYLVVLFSLDLVVQEEELNEDDKKECQKLVQSYLVQQDWMQKAKRGRLLQCIGKGPCVVYPLCILTVSLVYSSRLQWHFGFRTRMLSLLVARWPGSRSASLCFVAWLEFGTPWHLACCPGRQPGHRLFFEVRSIGKQMVGWQLREDRLCLGDFCQLLLFLAANDKGDSDKSLVQPCHRSQPWWLDSLGGVKS